MAATCGQAHSCEVVTVSQLDRVTDAARIMHDHRVGCLVVLDDAETMVGVVSERDILCWISLATPEAYFQRVRDIMTADVVSASAGTPLEEARELRMANGVRHLPVLENGTPVGMISIRDLVSRQD